MTEQDNSARNDISSGVTKLDQIINKLHDLRHTIQLTLLSLSGKSVIQNEKQVSDGLKNSATQGLTSINEITTLINESSTIFQKPAPLSKEQDVLPPWLTTLLKKYSKAANELFVKNDSIFSHEPKNDTSISARDDNSTAKLDTSVRLDLHNIEENVKAIEQYLEHTNVHIESNVDTSIHIKADIPNKLKLMIICELGDSNEQLDTTGPKLSISGPYEDITFQDSSAFQVFNAIKEQFNELFGQIGKCMTVGDLYDILGLFNCYEDLFRARCNICSRHLKYDFRFGQFMPPTCRTKETASDPSGKKATDNINSYTATHYDCQEL